MTWNSKLDRAAPDPLDSGLGAAIDRRAGAWSELGQPDNLHNKKAQVTIQLFKASKMGEEQKGGPPFQMRGREIRVGYIGMSLLRSR